MIEEIRYNKNCPKCGRKQNYKRKCSYLRAIKRKAICSDCSHKTIKPGTIFIHKCRDCCREVIYKSYKSYWVAQKNNSRCRDCLKELKRIETLRRLRDMNGNWYNKKACDYIDNLNKQYGYNLQHANNGGEVILAGYSIDGYDREKNIVFEYDEPRHELAVQKQKDLKRQEYIIKRVNPSMFLRYSEKLGILYNVINN